MNEYKWYLYLIHESPILKPYFCKIGITCNPLRRLDQLQAGNPRSLRVWEFERRPTQQFGFSLPTKAHAKKLEHRVHQRFENAGMRVRRDINYETNSAPKREWFAELHPEKLWHLIAEMYFEYMEENKIPLP